MRNKIVGKILIDNENYEEGKYQEYLKLVEKAFLDVSSLLIDIKGKMIYVVFDKVENIRA